MALHFSPERESILKEVKPWRLDTAPPALKLTNPSPDYALIVIMAGDDADLGGQVERDLNEIALGVHGGPEVTALVLADMAGPPRRSVYYEITGAGHNIIKEAKSIDTGDPRPIAAFLTAALNSLHPDTKIAIGLWGHGDGVIGDLDPNENLIPEALRERPLGTPISEAEFLKHSLLDSGPIKPLLFKSMLPDMDTGNVLTNRELSSALTVAFSRCERTEPVDMIFFDTCYNAAAEVYGEVRRYAHTFVASSLKLPATGWAYTDFLQRTRRKLPGTAQDWARIAIESCDHAYNPEYYPSPVHMVALDCQTQAFEYLREVVTKIQELPHQQAVSLLQQASKDLKEVGRNESLDLFLIVNSIRQATDDKETQDKCRRFLDAYQQTVIASTAPANDGRIYTGLTVWFPRLGDAHNVHKYYQSLQFNDETKWLDLIEHLIFRPQKASSVFLVYCFQGLELLEAHPVGQLLIDTDPLRDTTLLLKISDESAPWTTSLEEGRYSYKKAENITFPSHQDFRRFIEVLRDVRRETFEFEAVEAARYGAICFDSIQAKHLIRALWKYKNVVADEFPLTLDSYEALENLVKQAKENSVIVIGQGSRSHKPSSGLASMLRASDLLTRITFDLLTEAPQGFTVAIDGIKYYRGPLEFWDTFDYEALDIGEILELFSGLNMEDLNGVYIHVHKFTTDDGEDSYSAVVWGDKIVTKDHPGINYQWSEWTTCPDCESLLTVGSACSQCAKPKRKSSKSFLFNSMLKKYNDLKTKAANPDAPPET